MKCIPVYACIMAGLLLSASGSAFSQPAPVKKAQKVIKKVTNRVVRGTKQTTQQVKRVAAKAGKEAKIHAEAVVTNLPTPEWTKLQAAYDYPAGTPQVEEFPKAHPNAMMVKIKFTGVNNKPAEGIFLRPKAEGTYPCALLLHGLTNNKEIIIKMFGDMLLARNFAVLALDAPHHGAERRPNQQYWSRRLVSTTVREGDRNYRRALDWLTERPDIDSSRIGLIGYSMGSIMGSILGAVDDRISAFALCVGGDPLRFLARTTPVARREAMLYASPSLYIEHITPRPVVFFNGTRDAVIPQPAAKLLHGAAKDPKQVVWYNGTHDVPKAILKRAVDWLAEKVGSDQPAAEAAPSEEKDPNKSDPPAPHRG
jgi:dienelactone hydrolase